jgi:hypothetical protein
MKKKLKKNKAMTRNDVEQIKGSGQFSLYLYPLGT